MWQEMFVRPHLGGDVKVLPGGKMVVGYAAVDEAMYRHQVEELATEEEERVQVGRCRLTPG